MRWEERNSKTSSCHGQGKSRMHPHWQEASIRGRMFAGTQFQDSVLCIRSKLRLQKLKSFALTVQADHSLLTPATDKQTNRANDESRARTQTWLGKHFVLWDGLESGCQEGCPDSCKKEKLTKWRTKDNQRSSGTPFGEGSRLATPRALNSRSPCQKHEMLIRNSFVAHFKHLLTEYLVTWGQHTLPAKTTFNQTYKRKSRGGVLTWRDG